MRANESSSFAATPLAVDWVEALPKAIELRQRRPSAGLFWRGRGRLLGSRRRGRCAAFTLLELMVVLAIIGFIAALTLPHVSGFNKANTVSAATRQLLDDVARARSRAMVNRSTVYMVFLPAFWSSVEGLESLALEPTPQFTNLLTHQYSAYALYSSRTVGDQPGQHFPHYLTEWQVLPTGIYVWPGQFSTALNPLPVTIRTTNTFNNSTNADLIFPFATNSFYFPSVSVGVQTNLPYIGFTPSGTLIGSTNQYIVMTRGSVMYAQGTNGVPVAGPPDAEEAPPGNETNNPCVIKIDGLTARAIVVQNQFQ